MKNRRVLLGITLFMLSFFIEGRAYGEIGFKKAPLSPAFLAYRESLGQSTRGVNSWKKGTGYIPHPVDMSHLRDADYSSYFAGPRLRATPPAKYDLRDERAVTDVRDQGAEGACWAFATLGSMESVWLRGEKQTLDLSPMHLAYYTFMMPGGFTNKRPVSQVLSEGGNYFMSIAMLSRWAGPVLESALPYGSTPTGTYDRYTNALHLQNAYYASMVENDQTTPTNDIRKRFIMDYGGIAIAYTSDVENLNPATDAWYNPSEATINHGVLVIGWDDNYDRNNFIRGRAPSRNGAWLVQNSWGTDWGNNGGYFWLSYEDKTLEQGVIFLPEATTNYDNVYDYDILGCLGMYGGRSQPTTWMANVFQARNAEKLEAVSFYTLDANSSYEISVYTNLADATDPASGRLASATQRGTQTFAGYHTVELDTPVTLAERTTFSVVVKMTTPTVETYQIAVEMRVVGVSDEVKVNRGESFLSLDGTTWTDGFDLRDPINVCLKAFTSDTSGSTPEPSDPIIPNPSDPVIPNPSDPVIPNPSDPVTPNPSDPTDPTSGSWILPPLEPTTEPTTAPATGPTSPVTNRRSSSGGCNSISGALFAMIPLFLLRKVRSTKR